MTIYITTGKGYGKTLIFAEIWLGMIIKIFRLLTVPFIRWLKMHIFLLPLGVF